VVVLYHTLLSLIATFPLWLALRGVALLCGAGEPGAQGEEQRHDAGPERQQGHQEGHGQVQGVHTEGHGECNWTPCFSALILLCMNEAMINRFEGSVHIPFSPSPITQGIHTLVSET
jgi:hypothetical protein